MWGSSARKASIDLMALAIDDGSSVRSESGEARGDKEPPSSGSVPKRSDSSYGSAVLVS